LSGSCKVTRVESGLWAMLPGDLETNMRIADQSTRVQRWHISHEQAYAMCLELSEKWKLSQTIYLSDTGFDSRATGCPSLDDAAVTVTILPPGYFN
jgi:hypothetical protein